MTLLTDLQIFPLVEHLACQNIVSIHLRFNRVQGFPIKDSVKFTDLTVFPLHFIQWAG